MSHERSFQTTTMPSAVLADPPVLFVPLFAVTAIALTETFYLPPLGVGRQRMVVPAHDDTITLSALLIGPLRYTWKYMLETMADLSKRGGALESIAKGRVGGLVLLTSMALRTDMQIQSLSFSSNTTRRDVVETSITMVHVPRPNSVSRVLEMASVAVGALADYSK
jgi:hypothetical protein